MVSGVRKIIFKNLKNCSNVRGANLSGSQCNSPLFTNTVFFSRLVQRVAFYVIKIQAQFFPNAHLLSWSHLKYFTMRKKKGESPLSSPSLYRNKLINISTSRCKTHKSLFRSLSLSLFLCVCCFKHTTTITKHKFLERDTNSKRSQQVFIQTKNSIGTINYQFRASIVVKLGASSGSDFDFWLV